MFYCVLLDFTGYYWILPGFTRRNWLLLSFMGYFQSDVAPAWKWRGPKTNSNGSAASNNGPLFLLARRSDWTAVVDGLRFVCGPSPLGPPTGNRRSTEFFQCSVS